MSQHSVSEVRRHLSKLIDRALAGEPVTITRRGRPVVTLNVPLPDDQPAPTGTRRYDAAWFRVNAVKPSGEAADSGTLVSRMRDADWR